MAPTDVRALSVDVSDGAVPVVRLAGELDLSTVPHLTGAIERAAAAAPRPPRVVVDLTGLEFSDSTGLRALIGAVREVEVLGGRASVAVLPDGPFARLVELSGLREFLHVADSPEEALRRLGA
ncbi:MAG TPA: anti-sigma factor antagonist [Solirubrobacter sp.]|jgi:anti-sigma B factor antagonist|nr:anti-sigma factor antagonist [Solirubrobacter sp.]